METYLGVNWIIKFNYANKIRQIKNLRKEELMYRSIIEALWCRVD